MIAVFKNKLVARFDDAIRDAKNCDSTIDVFKLSSLEENKIMGLWMRHNGHHEGFGLYDLEYKGIPIEIFEPEVIQNEPDGKTAAPNEEMLVRLRRFQANALLKWFKCEYPTMVRPDIFSIDEMAKLLISEYGKGE